VRTLADLVPLRTAACREAVDAVGDLAAGEPGVDARAAAHVETCLRCQAEVLAYRRVLATMRAMRDEHFLVPSAVVDAALGALHADALHAEGADGSEGADGVPGWALRAAYVGGLTAAGAAGVLVWLGRRRLGLPNAS
jgi:hypothetical protein